MSLAAIVGKELADLVREKRFGAWALTFLAFWMLFLFFFLGNLQNNPGDPYGGASQSLVSLAEPAFFFYAIGFAVLALFVLSDGVTKEREAGMLALVAAKPIVRWHLVFAKLVAGLAVYVASYIVTLLPGLVLSLAMGFAALEMLTLLYVGPFLVLYLFFLGTGLLLGVAMSSSKVAIGTAAGLYIPLFFLMQNGPMSLLYTRYPRVQEIASYTPFEASHTATRVVINGGQMPWGPVFASVAIGIVCAALAFWLFNRQEAAA